MPCGAAEAGQFVVAGEADPDVAALGAQAGLLGAEGGVVDLFDGGLEAGRVGLAVVDQAGGRGVGQVGRADQVAAAQFNGSIPSAAAATSRMRSMTKVVAGRATPR